MSIESAGEVVGNMPGFIAVYYFGPSPENSGDFLYRRIEAENISDAERTVTHELANETFRFEEDSDSRCIVRSRAVLYVKVAPEERPDLEAIRAANAASKEAASKEAARRDNYVRRVRQ